MRSAQLPAFVPLPTSRPNRWLLPSLTFHAGLLILLLVHHRPMLKATQLAGDTSGHYLLLTYIPGSGAARAVPQVARPVPDKLPNFHPSIAPAPPSAPKPEASFTPDNTGGSDTLGQGNIRIASLLNHPPPQPNLAALPAGTRGDVVVDIVIDPHGRVASYTLTRGLGYGIDQTVLATIQQWTFQPATRDGVPVASEQELLFHYERG
jgi:protein TonB